MKGDLGKAFGKLKDSMYITYRGCLIERKNGKFVWAHKIHDTEDEAKETIDQAYKELSKENKDI